jgi:hypothetical protein
MAIILGAEANCALVSTQATQVTKDTNFRFNLRVPSWPAWILKKLNLRCQTNDGRRTRRKRSGFVPQGCYAIVRRSSLVRRRF